MAKIVYKLESYSELPSVQGIYFITNIINNKYYLGRAVNIKWRYSWKDIEYSHHNYLLRNSILKYGRENFKISIVEYPNVSLEELINIEQGLLDIHYGNGLCINLSPFATNYSASGENHPNFGKTMYNNGIEHRYFSPEEEIPEGYFLGRKEETKQKNSGENHPCYGKIRINNGIKEIYISPDEEIPEGYFLGIKEETKRKQSEAKKGENNPLRGKKCYNNGIENKFFSPDEEIPEGFILGLKEETRQKKSGENDSNHGKKCYNNGIKNKYFSPEEEIPEGFILGGKPLSVEMSRS